MKRRPFVAGLLSLVVPGLGQMYAGHGKRGAAILATAIIIGNLNLIFLVVLAAADPDPQVVWAYWIPRIGHDVMSLWSIVFWIWAVVDASVDFWSRNGSLPAKESARQGRQDE